MSQVVAIGEPARVDGLVLAGVRVMAATGDAEVVAAWEDMPGDVGLVMLTARAAAVLRERLAQRPRLLWVELP